MMEPTFPGPKPRISVHFKRIVRVDGMRVRVELEPGCWVRGSTLGLYAAHPKAGSVRLTSRRAFEKAGPADLEALIRRLRTAACRKPGCRQRRLVGNGPEPGNPKGLCERHRLQDILAEAERERARAREEEARHDAKKRAAGYRYKAVVWIHRDDCDDRAVVLYFREKPTRAALRREGRRRKSRLPDDFSLSPI